MKYKLTKNSIEIFGKKLYQIQAIASFGSVVKGELGGYIESKKNLDVSGNAWVYGDARVYGNARVYGDAWVYGKIKIGVGYFFGFLLSFEKCLFTNPKNPSSTNINVLSTIEYLLKFLENSHPATSRSPGIILAILKLLCKINNLIFISLAKKNPQIFQLLNLL